MLGNLAGDDECDRIDAGRRELVIDDATDSVCWDLRRPLETTQPVS